MGVLLAGAGGIALLGGGVWSQVEAWDTPAYFLIGAGAAALVFALALNLREVFSTARGLAGVNAVVSGGLAVIGFGLLSYINHSLVQGGFDLTQSRKFTLSGSTRALLAGLEKPVEVTAILSPEDSGVDHIDLNLEIKDLVRQFESHGAGKCTVRIWDPVADEIQILGFIREIGRKSDELYLPGVVVRCGHAHRLLVQGDFIQTEEDSKALFWGEKALTNAVAEVTEGKKSRVYFTRGHGEGEIDLHDDFGFSRVQAALTGEFLEPLALDIEKTRAVPEDCAVLVVLSPKRRFTPDAVRVLDGYLDRGGRMLVFLDSDVEVQEKPDGLVEVLGRWGVERFQGVVVDPEENFADNPTWIWIAEYGEHVMVEALEGSPSIFMLPCGLGLKEDARTLAGHPLVLTPLLRTSAKSWCESEPATLTEKEDIVPGKGDVRGPIVIGVAVRESSPARNRDDEARLVVLGDASFLMDVNLRRFSYFSSTHLHILKNSVNWLLEREARIPVSPRRYHMVRRLTPVDISDRSIRLVMWGGMMGMPFLVLVAGILVWAIRRR